MIRKKDEERKIPQNNTSTSGRSHTILIMKICAASVKEIITLKVFQFFIIVK